MAKGNITIEGISELVEGLLELPKATATNIQKRVLMKAAQPIENTAKSLAPYRTGLLERSIDISTRLSPRQKRSHNKESKIEVYVGPGSMTRAIVAEFGSVHQTPRAFMRPAWDANKKTAFNSIRDDMEQEIEKARQRIARKTARLLAKK